MTRFKDLSGQRFGKLLVIKRVVPQPGRTVKYHCICDCGTETIVQRANLQAGSTKSCGQHNYKDLANQKFGRFTCLYRGKGYRHKNGIDITWICECECGNKKDIRGRDLITGNTKSCGCLARQRTSERSFTGYKNISGKYWSTVTGPARRRGLDFDITKEFIWDLFEKQDKKCALSGLDISFELDSSKQTASIDRISSQRGYTKDNVQIVHRIVNIMKNKFDQDEFIKICKLIAKNNED